MIGHCKNCSDVGEDSLRRYYQRRYRRPNSAAGVEIMQNIDLRGQSAQHQDKLYGRGNRVLNPKPNGEKRCSLCGVSGV